MADPKIDPKTDPEADIEVGSEADPQAESKAGSEAGSDSDHTISAEPSAPVGPSRPNYAVDYFKPGDPVDPIFPTRQYYTDNNPWRAQMPTSLMPRPPKFNSSGKAAIINVNSHKILAYPTHTIYQYDVSPLPHPQQSSVPETSPDQHRKRSREARSDQGCLGEQTRQRHNWTGFYI